MGKIKLYTTNKCWANAGNLFREHFNFYNEKITGHSRITYRFHKTNETM